MNKQFLNYKLSKELKFLDFNEECLAYYANCNNELILRTRMKRTNSEMTNVSAPLHQQVLDWFRNVHHIHVVVDLSNGLEYFCPVYDSTDAKEIRLTTPTFNTYEEAIEDVIEYVIKKLKVRKLFRL